MESLINTIIANIYQFTIGLATMLFIALVGASFSFTARAECLPSYGYNVPGRREAKVIGETKYKTWWHNGRLKVSFKKPKVTNGTHRTRV